MCRSGLRTKRGAVLVFFMGEQREVVSSVAIVIALRGSNYQLTIRQLGNALLRNVVSERSSAARQASVVPLLVLVVTERDYCEAGALGLPQRNSGSERRASLRAIMSIFLYRFETTVIRGAEVVQEEVRNMSC